MRPSVPPNRKPTLVTDGIEGVTNEYKLESQNPELEGMQKYQQAQLLALHRTAQESHHVQVVKTCHFTLLCMVKHGVWFIWFVLDSDVHRCGVYHL